MEILLTYAPRPTDGGPRFSPFRVAPVKETMSVSVLNIPLVSSVLLAAGLVLPSLAAQSVTIPTGVPLRVQIDHRYRVRSGVRIEGHLIAPVDSIDHAVFPVNTHISGVILGMKPDPSQSRFRAMLNGQFTSPAVAAVRFDSLRLPSGVTLPIQTAATHRDATVVTMKAGKKSGLRAKARDLLKARKRDALQTLDHPRLGDRLMKLLYAQLPWSPPTIWTGAEYDAELTAPVTVPGPQPAPLPEAIVHGTPTGLVEARLITPLNSAVDHRGTPVTAELTQPLLTTNGKQVLFPQGSRITGFVTVARRARWFGRNGQLRFTFRNIEREDAAPAAIHGQIAAAEAAPGAHVKIDDEGTAKSSSGPGKYLAPMALGALAASAFDTDATGNPMHSGLDSNGFGFAARVAVMTSANAVLLHTFAIYAVSQSVFFRWIVRGHEVDFPKDTRVKILLNSR